MGDSGTIDRKSLLIRRRPFVYGAGVRGYVGRSLMALVGWLKRAVAVTSRTASYSTSQSPWAGQ